MIETIETNNKLSEKTNYKGFFVDLFIYLSVMFLVRELYIPKVGFIANGLFWSFTTLIIAHSVLNTVSMMGRVMD